MKVNMTGTLSFKGTGSNIRDAQVVNDGDGDITLTVRTFSDILEVKNLPRRDAARLASALLRASERPVEEDAVFRGFSRPKLVEAFGKVSNPADWKAPIEIEILTMDVNITVAAIEFFTATPAEVLPAVRMGYSFVKSIGYRKGPAGP